VRYRPLAKAGAVPMTWLEVEVEGTSYTLNGLALETEYECGVQSVCNKLGQQESEYAAFDNFTTLALTCFTPTEVRILDIKPTSISISWTGTSDNYQVAWIPQGSGNNVWTYSDIITGESYTITGLNYYSFYTFKMRGVCAAGDSSEWTETRNFRTLPRQACPDPTNLRVEALTQTSATLCWDAEETEEGDIQSYVLRHRQASVQAWDSIKDVKGNTYAITGMAPKTAYVWAVMTACLDDRYSENWAQLRFETPANDTTPSDTTTAVEGLKGNAGLYVAAAQGQVYVMNPQAVQIDNIRIFSAMGQRLEQYAVNSRDNVILTTEVRNSIVIVEIESEGRFFRIKTMLP
ncbi:MAG: fibronectin type III domain-containing protein, partial [Bacteroidales bacterium]|nr:fibronectin type III domain-containing protein [Bacteroidales bacterium]